jgi:flagellar biosynthesis GTPase FlhF
LLVHFFSFSLSYFFVAGKTRLCTKSIDPPPTEDDIVLSGLQIKADHAVVDYTPAKQELFLTPGEGARVFINGKLIKERTELCHNDRLICGAHLVFRVIFPNHAADDGDSLFDWEYATKEMTTSTIEALNAPDPETVRQQQEAAEKMAKMQAEIEAERVRAKEDQQRKQAEYEATLRDIAKKKEDEIAAAKQAIVNASAADSQKLSKKLAEREAELERERAAAAKQHSERLEAMRKEQNALEAKLAQQREETKALHKKHEVEKRDRQLLEENLVSITAAALW